MAEAEDEGITTMSDKPYICGPCGHKIRFRPHAARIAEKRCIQCALPAIGDADEIALTPEAVAELRRHRRQ